MLKISKYGDVVVFKAARTFFRKPLYYTHFYYLDGILIDSGPSIIEKEVLGALSQFSPKKMLLSHEHEDHSGNCAAIKKKFGITVLADPHTLSYIKNPPPIEIYRHIMWGAQPAVTGKPLPEKIDTRNYSIKVIRTPGHSGGHTSYFEPENRSLFCGDLFLGEKLNGFMASENIADHMRSLKKVIELEPKTLFCGLKGPIDNAAARLQRKYDTWWELGCRAVEMHSYGASKNEILNSLFGGEIYFFHLSQRNWGRGYMLDTIINNQNFFKDNKNKQPVKGCCKNR